MKKLLLIVATALVACASSYWTAEPKDPPKPDVPRYLLVHRYWGSSMVSNGPVMTHETGYVYLTETFKDADTLKARLDSLVKQSGLKEQHVVGVWILSELSRVKVKIWNTERIIPKHVEEERLTERHWKVEWQEEKSP